MRNFYKIDLKLNREVYTYFAYDQAHVVNIINRCMGFNMISPCTIKNWMRSDSQKSDRYHFIDISKVRASKIPEGNGTLPPIPFGSQTPTSPRHRLERGNLVAA